MDRIELMSSADLADRARIQRLLSNGDVPSWLDGDAVTIRSGDRAVAEGSLDAIDGLPLLPPEGAPEVELPWYCQPGAMALIVVLFVALAIDYRIFVLAAILVGPRLAVRYWLTKRRGEDRFDGPGPHPVRPVDESVPRRGRTGR